ncbi:hypothetical protein SAMN05443667_113161 [Flavobacterium gillisiae]|uniref:Uncharacterized protein n=1 Tax=Flavobacterium gillisiae TaxID=150146 RepID=A0A1H4FJ19_9FLAO|nr:hypothetical protein [Flavobacterium gillisiae]SEA97353.1 hypothetical protein SAMN05443667_113161 [Flavobacterium gillisiae]
MISISNIQISFFCLSLVLSSCKNSSESPQTINHSAFDVKKEIEPSELGQYAQQVTGTDENGNNVHGKINIEGKIGLGTLVKKDTKNIEIVVEWNGINRLLATDSEGYQYNLKLK